MTPDGLSAVRRSRIRVGLGAVVVLLIVCLGVAVLVSAFASAGTTRTIASSASPTGVASLGAVTGTATRSPGIVIFVHILGAVVRPGLYQLHDGDRGVDAVAAAGGFTDAADRQQLNLARIVADGEQIYIPAVGEVGSAQGPDPAAGSAGSAGSAGITGKVNINTADAETLETLPRVGPAMAERIIAWRKTNGRFAAVEDLMSVTGIGDKTFAQLKDRVTV